MQRINQIAWLSLNVVRNKETQRYMEQVTSHMSQFHNISSVQSIVMEQLNIWKNSADCI